MRMCSIDILLAAILPLRTAASNHAAMSECVVLWSCAWLYGRRLQLYDLTGYVRL